MIIGRLATKRLRRYLAMALVALAPLLFHVDPTPLSGGPAAPPPMMQEASATGPEAPLAGGQMSLDDEDRDGGSAEVQPGLPAPVTAFVGRSARPRMEPIASIYLPPDVPPLLPPPIRTDRI